MALNIDESFNKVNDNLVMHFQNNDGSLLDEAKELFSTLIKSNRQLQRVQNINQLLLLLQRRELHGPFDFVAFRIFQKIIVNDEFVALAQDHQSRLSTVQKPLKNQYATTRCSNTSSENRNRASTEFTQISIEKQNNVFKTIADRFSARDVLRLGRALDFSERDLKEIEERCTDCHTRTIVLLGHYKQRKNSIRKLLMALELIGKFDIVRDVKSILERN